jgi:20S proteasome alpha/beta subunit
VEEAAKDIINSIAERDIYTGDQVEIVQIDA